MGEQAAAARFDVLGVDPGPMARLEVVVGEPTTPSVVFQRVADGETLKAIAKSWGVPTGRFTEWFTTEHATLYDAALKVRADQDAHETVEIADAASPEDVQQAKLRVDARKWRSSKWDRDRYGEKAGSTTINVNSPGSLVNILSGMDAVVAQPGDGARVIEHAEEDQI